MNRREVIEDITSDAKFMQTWRVLIKDGTVDKMLELCNCFRAPYNKDAKPDPLPHVQAENNGGMKAWDKLAYLLTSCPYHDNNLKKKGEEYIGYIKDHVSTRRQKEFSEGAFGEAGYETIDE